MGLDRDSSIIAQNAGTTAAAIYNVLVAQRGDTTFDPEEYEAIRLHVFQGTLSLAGAETVVEKFEAPAEATTYAPPTAVPSGDSGGGKPNADLVINFGKHRGKKVADIAKVDRSWLEWVARESNNEFVKTRVAKFLAA